MTHLVSRASPRGWSLPLPASAPTVLSTQRGWPPPQPRCGRRAWQRKAPRPGRGPAKATATASRFRPQFGKSGGLRGANTAEAPAFPSSGAPCSGAPPETGHKQSWWGWGSVSPHLDEPGVHLKGHQLAGCQVSCHTPRSASAVTASPRFSSSKDRNSVIFSQPVSLAPAGSPWRGTAGLIQPDVVCVYRLF